MKGIPRVNDRELLESLGLDCFWYDGDWIAFDMMARKSLWKGTFQIAFQIDEWEALRHMQKEGSTSIKAMGLKGFGTYQEQ